MKEAVIAIQTSKPIVYTQEELYQAVDSMCTHKMDSVLYVNLTGLAENHVKGNIRPFLAERIDKLVRNFIVFGAVDDSNHLHFTALSEESQRVLAVPLSTDDYDSKYISIFRSNLRVAESDCTFNLVRIAIPATVHVMLIVYRL